MDITKLFVDQEIKNYKEMCILINEVEKYGNSRKSQIKEWERYIRWEQVGHKVVIKEIYTEPKKSLVSKGGNNNAPYTYQIQKLVLDLLLQDNNDGHLLLSKYKLLQELNMINQNYSYSKRRIPKLSKFLNVNENDVYEFYETSSDMLIRNLEVSLNRLRSKAVVFWTKSIMLCTINIENKINDLGNPVVEKSFVGLDEDDEEVFDYKPRFDTVYNFRKATEEEVKMVLQIENEILYEMGRESKSDLIRYGLWEKFTHRLNSELLFRMGIDFCYDGYEIIFNKNHVQNEWDKLSDLLLISSEEKNEQRKLLNSGVGDRILVNTTKRHEKSILEIENTFGEISEKNKRRSAEEYIENNKKLVSKLIDHGAKNIKVDVRKTKTGK